MHIDGGWRDVRIVDISRTGVRLRVPLATLGFEPGAGLADLAAHLDRVVPRRAAAQFHPERLGALVERELHVVRIALPDGEGGEVELGCRMDRRLGDVEAAALDVPVPAEGQRIEEGPTRERYEVREHEGLQVSFLRNCEVLVRPADGDASREWSGAPERMDETGLTTRFRDRTRLGLTDEDDRDARSLAVAFSDVYGPQADLEIRAGTRTLYRGPGRLTRVQVEPRRPGDLIIGLAFDRELDDVEKQALRLI